MFQNKHGQILRITAMNALFNGCAVVYDTRDYYQREWYCNRVIVESDVPYWTIFKLIMSLHENVVEKTYADAMEHVSKTMSKFRVPHFDELIILDYSSMTTGSLVRQELIHVVGGKDSIEFNHEVLQESFVIPHILQLTKVKSILPDNAEENLDIRKLL